ncbi:sensor domain-containing protein [Sedimenticola selenatireducens]|uniref:sensor domain-containing protein n=1 Tax=Sedimenticola selenatireducens TaxID=191960 RepID=UPI0016435FFB|nr:EAL domain-containing protein [Sedimenticola selenatireducens]
MSINEEKNQLPPTVSNFTGDATIAEFSNLATYDKTAYLEYILNAPSTYALIATNLDFRITHYNPAAQRLFRLEDKALMGKRVTEFPQLGLSVQGEFSKAINKLKLMGEYRHTICSVANTCFVECVISGIYDSSENLIGYLLTGQDVTSRNIQQERATRKAAEEQCLGKLLRLSLNESSVDVFLQQSLEAILQSIPWLNLLPKGVIFLAEKNDQKDMLKMVASYQLNNTIKQVCKQVDFGYCVCGRAAAHKEVLFIADSHDDRHDVQYPGMEPHGHYSVPIILNETILGILTLYLPPGHTKMESDKSFLMRVANVLSIGVSKRKAEKALEYQAQYDALTKLPNRSQLMRQLDQALAKATRHDHYGAVMFIDLDHFKNINDSLGHNVGDEILQEVSVRLINILRKEDVVARLGGDEFVVLLTEVGSCPKEVARQAQLVAEKIRDSLSENYLINGYSLNITPSIGVALFPDNNENSHQVLQQADTAMYRAKSDGRNCIRFFLPVMQMIANERLEIEQDLRWALDTNKFQLHYQPQVDFNGRVVGAECLLRCPNSMGEFRRVDLCIDVAETTGLILPIGEWVLREACLNLKAWIDSGIATSLQHLCINISPKQFLQRDFVSLVQRVILETGVDPCKVVLEITESTLIDTNLDAISTMSALKELGVRIAIDDFGTGYSSLSYLTRLPLDILKIDRSFVLGVNNNQKNAAVVEALMAMARQLGLDIVSEGVETKDEINFLLEKGCECFQGFYYSKPLSMDAFLDYLRDPLVLIEH